MKKNQNKSSTQASKGIGYVAIAGILSLFVYLVKNQKPCDTQIVTKVDTVYITVHDTIRTKPVVIHEKPDTVWLTSVEYRPDTSYLGLLRQYKIIARDYFTTKTYENKVKLGAYGWATITDTVVKNSLIGHGIEAEWIIPSGTTKIIERIAAPVRSLSLGPVVTAGPTYVGGHLGALYKDKKDRTLGVTVGWHNQFQVGVGYYWKIKL